MKKDPSPDPADRRRATVHFLEGRITPLLQDFLEHPQARRKTRPRVCEVCGRVEVVTVSTRHRCPGTGRCPVCQCCDDCTPPDPPGTSK